MLGEVSLGPNKRQYTLLEAMSASVHAVHIGQPIQTEIHSRISLTIIDIHLAKINQLFTYSTLVTKYLCTNTN